MSEGITWTAKWISPSESSEESEREDRRAYVLRRSFDLPSQPEAATLYATALGIYEAFVNGVRVGDVELAPGSTNYDETLYV
ncbi:alpha-L-rhamnosidase N-terminal domain-containing protein, partial [Sinomonas sp. G460-2]|uniref:alpha-L-rhamnosidase N-terminal domain-containing protein n=1 Tax=Sinomonas sp. G460-2 TaxID=3393464 RepID=UPI0039EF10D5